MTYICFIKKIELEALNSADFLTVPLHQTAIVLLTLYLFKTDFLMVTFAMPYLLVLPS